MSLEGVILEPIEDECPYIEGYTSKNETLLIKDLEAYDMEAFLVRGFRHFGEVFFRPICRNCRRCIPIRIPVQRWSPTSSVKRLFSRCKGLDVTLEKPVASVEAFEVYQKHKSRFKRRDTESYELYEKSFFYPFDFNYVLAIRDKGRLVALSHLDVTAGAMSAIYTYFDEDYKRFSPGKLALYKEIELAGSMGIRWLYLGYYVEENRHMQYKIQYKPNQVMITDQVWIDYIDEKGEQVNPLPEPLFQTLVDYKDHFV